MTLVKLFKTRLAFRSAAIILLILALVGSLFLSVGHTLATRHEQQRQQDLLNGLLNTVDNTVRIAVFLGDTELAGEVASGLVQNVTVQSVAIRDEKAVLSRQAAPGNLGKSREADGASEPLVRKVVSPFRTEEVIGEIALVPNREAIAEAVAQNTRFITYFFVGLLATVALSIVAIVLMLITQPISAISRRLHGLKVEAGEKLEFPRGNETDEIGRLVGDVNAMIDYLVNLLSSEKQLRQEREREEKKFRAIVENAETGIFQLDAAGTLISSNPAFRRLFSATAHDIEAKKLRFTDMLGEAAPQVSALIRQAVESRQTLHADIQLGGAGATRWVHLALSPIEENQLQGVADDITDRKLAQEAAEAQAVTDPLTGISNRLGFERKLQWMIETCLRYPERRFALMMIDLDKFKAVNDTHGHLAGDRVLVTVAQRLSGLLRKTDFVARLGGDEFAVIIEAVEQREVLADIAGKIIQSVNEPVPLDGAVGEIGASIGIALYDGGYTAGSELVRDADQAMYLSKSEGRNRYQFFG